MTTSKFSSIDEYGFKRPDNFDYEQYEKFMSSYLGILVRRSKKWDKLLKGEKRLKSSSKLKRYIRKGIPSSLRTKVWVDISGVEELKSKYGEDLYSRRLLSILDSDIVQAIRTDLPRTFPENIYFIPLEGCQEQLYRVLFAYAADNTNVGYCQGLNYIAGLLLLVTKDEDVTFWLLKVLAEKILPDYYSRKMTDLMIDIEVFARILQTKMPDLHRHVTSLNIPWSLLIMKWFVCLYAEVFPTETVLRIWDCLFYEHSPIMFRVGLTLINHFRKPLLACDSFTSFTELFKGMPQDVFVLDCHAFMKRVFSENKNVTKSLLENLRKQMKKEKNVRSQ